MNSFQLVFKTLWYARSKWHNIAIELGRNPNDLDVIRMRHHDNPDECFKEVLTDWLRQDCPKPTWSAMAAALQPPSVGFGQLAETVGKMQYIGTNELVPCEGEEIEKSANIPDNVDKVFCCPCEECSLESYLDKGCPQSTSSSFPYLDVRKLDEDDKEDLIQKLSKDTADMINRFAELFDETCTSLGTRGVSVQRLARRALSLGAYESQEIQRPLLREDEKELRSSKTLDEAFLVLRHHMSFFNFELLQHIINCNDLCSDDDRKRMEEYRSKFDTFCKRKVFEVSPNAVGQATSSLKKHKREAFAVLMTKHEDKPNLVYVNAAKQKIASLLKLKPSTLHLHRIDEGSLILVFSVPEFVAQKLFPLDPVVLDELKAEGFLVFTATTTEEDACTQHIQRGIMYLYVCVCVCVCVCVLSLIHI